MIVYHASPFIVEHPEVKYSRDFLDFGKGFYLTTIREQAVKYGLRFVLRGQKAFLNQYELVEDLSGYDICTFDSYDEEWLDFVAQCRIGQDKTDYDIVFGGIADDRVFRTIDLFFSGEISKDEALKKLIFEKPNLQICIRTQLLLDAGLTYISSTEINDRY